jgi:hypothetical protein
MKPRFNIVVLLLVVVLFILSILSIVGKNRDGYAVSLPGTKWKWTGNGDWTEIEFTNDQKAKFKRMIPIYSYEMSVTYDNSQMSAWLTKMDAGGRLINHSVSQNSNGDLIYKMSSSLSFVFKKI